jgi:regulator of sirC expression with transglutaminase-like and TPR domain
MERAFLPDGRHELRVQADRDPFRDAVRCPSGRVDVLEAVLALALDARPDADVHAVRDAIEEWGERLSRRIRHAGARDEPLTGVLLLNRLLFDEEGFAGDPVTPHDPANAQLDLVLERRRGLPILLALLMVLVGKRAGLPLFGVAFPGRFLVGLAVPPRAVLFDPHQRGRLLSRADCADLLESLTGVRQRVRRDHVAPCSDRRLVERLLSNLKQAYLREGDLAAAVRVQARVVDLRPDEASPLQERAWLHFQAGRHEEALVDLEAAARLIRDDTAATDLRRQLEHVRRWIAAAAPR